MILLIDIGNTRLKWATQEGKHFAAHGAEVHDGWDASNFIERVMKMMAPPQRVLVSNVGGERIAAVVRDAISQQWALVPEFVVATAESCGVRNAYPVPENLGVDRWLGVIAAHAKAQRLTCIVGVGTAMTIDGVDGSGQHLGGVIVPGPDLMVASLLKNTSDIAPRAQRGTATDALFADNTLGAIRQGSGHALAALVDRSVTVLRERCGETPALLLTGGGATAIERLVCGPHELIPDLVLHGLAHYAAFAR
jgi:type III pantothenate kinase